ncbi:MAG: ImmA/IrrE family metallo-endopeptidase [Litorimonas sp.]
MVLKATRAAKELHRAYGMDRQELTRIDVYSTIHRSGAVLMFRPMDKLLGAYFKSDCKGIIINTERPVGQQRYTAAHELGHMIMKHDPHADDKDILRRSPLSATVGVPRQELEADVFASAFLLPTFVMVNHFRRQGLQPGQTLQAQDIYQASLRHGSSYKATLFAFQREGLISTSQRREFAKVAPRTLKRDLVGDSYDGDWRNRDVWRLTEADRGAVIEAMPGDLFALKLQENPSTGYVWTYDDLSNSGFATLEDTSVAARQNQFGAAARRWIVGDTSELLPGTYSLKEIRLFQPSTIAQELELGYRHGVGRESGLYANQMAA